MKPYNEEQSFGINQLVESDYFLKQADFYRLEENDETGKSIIDIKVSPDSTSICVANYDKKGRCSFTNLERNFGLGKCVDHALLLKEHDRWVLILIEMKTTIGENTWHHVKQKVRSSYLSMKALCVYLGIIVNNVKVYTTYETEKFYSDSGTNPLKKKAKLGERQIDSKKDEWDKNIIHINLYEELTFEHHPIKMESVNNCLFSEITL